MKVKQFKEWLDENYPHLKDSVSFGDLDQETTQNEFEIFKESMRQAATLPVMAVTEKQMKLMKRGAHFK